MSEESSKSRSWLWWGLGVLAGIGVGGAYAWRKTARRFRPQTSGTLSLPNLLAPVEVWRDRWGVPHIFAENEHDLFCTQGYIQAQDRFWQMELNRRIALGQLSAIFGRTTFEIDRHTHHVGLPRAATLDLAALDAKTAVILDAYSSGVNAFIEQKRLPVEFSLLRYQPEPWRPLDTLAWSKLFAWSLSTNIDLELARARLLKRLGPRLAAKLEPIYPKGHPLVEPPGANYEQAAAEILNSYKLHAFAPLLAEGGGSNNWVISGSRTASGYPLLANDPHLPLQIPSIWYEMHICCPTLESVGATLPGAPTVAIGHNRNIAWGATASMADVQDLFIELFHPDHPHQYLYDGSWQQAEVTTMEFAIKGETNYREEVLVTRHGPVIADLPIDNGSNHRNHYKLSLQWSGHEPMNLLTSFIALNRAQSWEEFRAVFTNWNVPSLNMVYADRAGNIGYQLIGKIPIRKTGGGTLPVPGWTSSNDWKGAIPYSELPSSYNPPTGLIVTANNKIVSDDYPYHLSSDFVTGYRAQRIRERLATREQLTVEDCRAIQTDFTTIPGRRFAKLLQAHVHRNELSPVAVRALIELESWSGEATINSTGETIYQLTMQRLLRLVLSDLLSDDLNSYLGLNEPGRISRINSLACRVMPMFLDMIERNDRSLLEEVTATQSWHDILQKSFEQAVAELAQRFGPNPQRWYWGRLHRAKFEHPLGKVAALRPFFNRGPYPIGGDADTPAQMAFVPFGALQNNFDVTGWAVSYRQVVDLSDFNRSLMCHTTGQSGSPFSPHYDDMIKLWCKGELHPMLSDPAEIERNLAAKLLLVPLETMRKWKLTNIE
ncbi:MAG: penicillin acylase family protein [Acidobacteriota bacterium]